jgi:HD superfamily phosphohydrolase
MCNALNELKGKSVEITAEEELSVKIAILLHDIGHGPFSHALEYRLVKEVGHESISLLIMQKLNKEFGGLLEIAIRIFTNKYPKQFLHQLVSGQLDVDRMDYLTRDSFFTGVSEGVIGYDRIIKMLTVHHGQLMVEEKAIYSIEKFLVSRRLMYWQVYLHKTVLSAEKMLVRIIERARELIAKGADLHSGSGPFDFFLKHPPGRDEIEKHLDKFCLLDDYDLTSAIKNWVFHPDPVLSNLCRFVTCRQLLKVRMQATPFAEGLVKEYKDRVAEQLGLGDHETNYFVFTGEAMNTTYNPSDERIQILFRDGHVKDISEVDNALIHQTLAAPVKNFYICYMR